MSETQFRGISLRRPTYERLMGFAGRLQATRNSRVIVSEAIDYLIDHADTSLTLRESPVKDSDVTIES